MTQLSLYASVTGCSNIISVEVQESFSAITATATVECDTTTLNLGDEITIDIGYASDHGVVHKGFVKKITRTRPENTFTIESADVLIRSVDYFIAADDPEHPFQRNNITSLNLVRDLLALAGITNVTTVEPGPAILTWGTNEDGARFNLQTVADAVRFIADMSGNHLFYDRDADLVQFQARRPYVFDGDVATLTFTDTGASRNIIDCRYESGTDKTRNVCKIYGRGDITARKRADNPYLVVDQAVVIAHELISSSSVAQQIADYNLELLNRLTETYTITLEGDHNIAARLIADLTESFSGASGRDVFLYAVSHFLNENYTVQVTAIP